MKFAVFASGYGTNLQAILNAIKKKKIKAELALVYSNNHKAHALERAKKAGVETLVLKYNDYTNKQSLERDLVIHLKRREIDFIVLAGYMRMLSAYFIKEYKNKILNVHPALLPSFKGVNGIKDTYTYGCKVAGATIHFVDEKMDSGPIIFQESCAIGERDTLDDVTEKVHKIEYRLYPKAIHYFAEGRLKITGRKVKILEKRRAKK